MIRISFSTYADFHCIFILPAVNVNWAFPKIGRYMFNITISFLTFYVKVYWIDKRLK